MSLADALYPVAGTAIVVAALSSAIRTVVLPRAAQDPIARTAALAVSTVDWPPAPQARLVIRAGYVSLRRDPAPDDPIGVIRAEYDEVYDRLAAAGLPMKADRDQAWRDFAEWRVNYDRVLLALSSLVMAPFARWSSDRSLSDWRRPPALRRRGRRLRRASR